MARAVAGVRVEVLAALAEAKVALAVVVQREVVTELVADEVARSVRVSPFSIKMATL